MSYHVHFSPGILRMDGDSDAVAIGLGAGLGGFVALV